jgi:hypothetical protein
LSTVGYKYEKSVRKVAPKYIDLKQAIYPVSNNQANSTHKVKATMGSIDDNPVPPSKKFNTSLTDFSTVHEDKTGPYAENLTVDALIVGAGFGKAFSPPIKQPAYQPHPGPIFSPNANPPSTNPTLIQPESSC